jgi:hypothetical protein
MFRSGKTAVVTQFLYDQFCPGYKETVEDMYRREQTTLNTEPVFVNV